MRGPPTTRLAAGVLSLPLHPKLGAPDLDQVIDTPPSRADVTPEWCVGSPHTSPRARRQATPFQRQRCTHASNWVCCQVFQKSACGTLAPSASR